MTIQAPVAPRTEPQTKPITGEELWAMGDIGPCELIDGEIVVMSPTGGVHSFVESKLDRRLGGFIEQNELGWSLVGEVGIYIHRAPDRIRTADFAFWTNERLPDGPPLGYLGVAPNLVVEIVSPNDRWEDLRRKIQEYFSIGVEEVWIIEPENRAVLIYRSPTEHSVLTKGDVITGSGPLEGFTLPVADLFGEMNVDEAS